MYNLVDATEGNIELIKNIKLENVLASKEEFDDTKDLVEYVNYSVKKFYKDYKLIIIDDCIAGIFFKRDYEDGILIDEIYIYDEYRNKGIGADLINNVNGDNIYLWVYKNNDNAIRLYKRLGFVVIEETQTRYKMKKETK